jgi:hypothetical protein
MTPQIIHKSRADKSSLFSGAIHVEIAFTYYKPA